MYTIYNRLVQGKCTGLCLGRYKVSESHGNEYRDGSSQRFHRSGVQGLRASKDPTKYVLKLQNRLMLRITGRVSGRVYSFPSVRQHVVASSVFVVLVNGSNTPVILFALTIIVHGTRDYRVLRIRSQSISTCRLNDVRLPISDDTPPEWSREGGYI